MRHRTTLALVVALAAASLAPATAHAQDQADDAPRFMVGARVGVALPQLFNRLDTSFDVRLGLGYILPALDHRLAVVADVTYVRPKRDGTLEDPRLTAGSYDYELTQHDLSVFVGAHYHFLELGETLVPYAALGVRVHALRSEIRGEAADQPFGLNEETSTSFGPVVRGGLGLTLGPGYLSLEVELGYTPIDHLVTGDENVGRLALTLGYTLTL